MQLPKDINEYLRASASELADRILRAYPPLHGIGDPASPLIGHLLRKPFPAQILAMILRCAPPTKSWKRTSRRLCKSIGGIQL
jgi:hypothetical protein